MNRCGRKHAWTYVNPDKEKLNRVSESYGSVFLVEPVKPCFSKQDCRLGRPPVMLSSHQTPELQINLCTRHGIQTHLSVFACCDSFSIMGASQPRHGWKLSHGSELHMCNFYCTFKKKKERKKRRAVFRGQGEKKFSLHTVEQLAQLSAWKRKPSVVKKLLPMTSLCLLSDLGGHVGHALSFPPSAIQIIHLIYGLREEQLPTSAPWRQQMKCWLTLLFLFQPEREFWTHPSILSCFEEKFPFQSWRETTLR